MIKDIVNRDLINLINCDSEPIHIPGSIQPHGFTLALDRDTLIVAFCSANVTAFMDATPELLLGKEIGVAFAPEEVTGFKTYIENFIPDNTYPHVFTLRDMQYNTTVSITGSHYLLEFEPFPDGSLHLPDLYAQTRKFVSFIESSVYLLDLCQSVARETRAITGYDRVMIYRFDQDYNGEVYAESKRDDLESFLDHRYPHTDIPAQARELYMRNLLRIIVDVNYTPVPLLTLQSNATNAALDLSNAILRSVSPIHIEYLKNMGVGATLTISLIHAGRLWGLISCHHYTPKVLPHYTRLAALLQGHFLTSQINVREVQEEYDVAQKSEAHLKYLQELLQAHEQFAQDCYDDPALLDLTEATGVVIVHDGRICRHGHTPDDAAITELIGMIRTRAPQGSFSTSNLAGTFPEAQVWAATVSGVIYHSLGIENDCILWFRPEVVQTINWAGDPNKAVLKGEDGMRLTPRKSFEIWREFVRFQSIPWAKSHLNSAASFAYALQKHLLFQYLSREEERYRKLSEKLQEANEELANINWISTHDLKEPLRKIQIFGSRILDSDKDNLSKGVQDAVVRMRSAANRMQKLLDDILAYANLNSKEQAYTLVDLNSILAEVVDQLKDETGSLDLKLEAGALPQINGIAFQLQQLFQNLISNAIKFARKDVPLVVQISADDMINDGEPFYRIRFADNGIGFDEQYAGKIFEVFQRLHNMEEYAGTGIGLSICRKIMSNHNGYITANGQPGIGATFFLYFPKEG